MKCGDCQAVCPTFAITGDESSLARGRVRLIRAFEEGELELTDTLVDKINSCMMCMACTANCPSGVKVDEIIISARKKIVEERGLSAPGRIVNIALKHPFLISLASLAAPILRPLFGDIIPEKSRKVSREGPPDVKEPKTNVALFGGCILNYIYPEIRGAALSVLAKNGVHVVQCKEMCCGAPALFCGEEKSARRLAQENVKRFSKLDVDAVVTCCPTCANMLKRYPSLLEGDERAVELAEKVQDISQFLVKMGLNAGEIEGSIGYHESCHQKYGGEGMQKEMEIIRSMQEKIEGLEGCCGFAGMFSFSHPNLSKMLSDKKMDDIEASGVDIVVTGCPGCKMHIEKGLKQRGLDYKVMHTAELLDEACG